MTYPNIIPSGIDIVPEISGVNNLGNLRHPFKNLYTDQMILTNMPHTAVAWTSGNLTATIIGDTTNWFTVSGTYNQGLVFNPDFALTPTPFKITYNGPHNIYTHVSWNCSISSAGTNQTGEIAIFKNNQLVQSSVIERRFGNTDTGALATACVVPMASGDYIALKAKNETSASNFTVSYGNVILNSY